MKVVKLSSAIVSLAVAALLAISVPAGAAGGDGKGPSPDQRPCYKAGEGAGAPCGKGRGGRGMHHRGCPKHQGCGFVDEDGDGICDRQPGQKGAGQGKAAPADVKGKKK
ncbi:MAG: hypothetical protein ABFR97_04035 [Thermodesulfobacteriota bacterium]